MKYVKNRPYALARDALSACVTREGFAAGAHHFVDLWARDSLFATFGANAAGLAHVSKKTIETFLRFQRRDGLVPYLILRSRHTVGKYFNRHRYYRTPVPQFRSHMSFGIVPDGNAMVIIAAWEYAKQSGDVRFLNARYSRLADAFSWYERRSFGGLMREWFQCEWADALLKSGNTLYTNVLYFRAAADLALIAGKLGKQSDAARFSARAGEIKNLINAKLWTGEFFADWKDWKRQDYLAVHPNMLAIIFGLATKKQAASMLAAVKTHAWNGWTMENSVPNYPIWRVPLFHIAVGMRDYHNGLIWLQPGLLYAIALSMYGKRKEAQSVLSGIARKIAESGGAHEVYERTGTPVRRWVYRSEHPFAWSAGLFLWASHILRKNT